MSHSVF